MIIDRIILKNFKRFREQEIRFRDGITGIVGNNGTGKSSIVEAILFALYGVQATGISGDYIVSSFASQKENCEVRLDFRIGGDNYTVIRSFKKGKTVQHDARFYRGTSLRATGVSQVETEVRRVLGMGPVDFRNTIYAAQKDLLTLLENTPGKRKEWFLKALGIDFLKTASEKLLKERIDNKENELRAKEGELGGLLGRQDPEELNTLRSSAVMFQAAVGELNKQRECQLQKKSEVSAESALFSEKKTQYTRLVEQQKSLVNEAGGLERQRDQVRVQLSTLAGLEQEYVHLEQRVCLVDEKRKHLESVRKQKAESDQLRAELKFMETDSGNFKARVDSTRTKIAVFDEDSKRLASLRNGIRSLMQIGPDIPDSDLEKVIMQREAVLFHTIGTLSARAAGLETGKKKLNADWDTIKNAGANGVCPLCRQTLGNHYASIEEEFTTTLEQIGQEALEVRDEQDKVAIEKNRIADQKPALQEIRSISEKLKAREATETELEDLVAQREAKELALRTLATRITSLGYDEAAFTKAEKDVKDLEQLHLRYVDLGKKIAQGAVLRQQVTELENKVTQKQRELEVLKTLITQAAFDPQIGINLEQTLAMAETALRTAETDLARTTERLTHANEKIARHENEMAIIEGLRQQAATLTEEIDLLRLTRTVIGDYVIYLMQVVRSRIEGEVSRIISEITSGRYEQVLLDEDFNLLVRDVDNDYGINRFSGGEQDDIAVALRIALSRYLAELHQVHESTLLIFDEIFGSQDEERRTNLLTALRTQESRFPQIILISHISEMQGEFTNTLVVEMGTDHSSNVKELA
jgi:DNA repair protein SbcC/Rad50